MDYVHVPLLAPTQELLDRYKKKGGRCSEYEHDFLELIRLGNIERMFREKQSRKLVCFAVKKNRNIVIDGLLQSI